MERHAAVRRRASLDVMPVSPRSQKSYLLRQHPTLVKATTHLSRRSSLPSASEMHSERIMLDCPGFPQTGFTAVAPRLGAKMHLEDSCRRQSTSSFKPSTTQGFAKVPHDDISRQPRARKITCEALQRRRHSLNSGAPGGFLEQATTSGRAARSVHTRPVASPLHDTTRTTRRLRSFDDQHCLSCSERDCDITIGTVDTTSVATRRRHARRGSADHVTVSGMNSNAPVGVSGAVNSAASALGGRRLGTRRVHRRSSLETNTRSARCSRTDDRQIPTGLSQPSCTANHQKRNERPLSPHTLVDDANFLYEFNDNDPDIDEFGGDDPKCSARGSDFRNPWDGNPFITETPMRPEKPKMFPRRTMKHYHGQISVPGVQQHATAAAVATTLDTRALGVLRDSCESTGASATRITTRGGSSDGTSDGLGRSSNGLGSSPSSRISGFGSAGMLPEGRREGSANSSDTRLNRFRRANSMQPISRLERNAIRGQSRGRSASQTKPLARFALSPSKPCGSFTETERTSGIEGLRPSKVRSLSLQPRASPRHSQGSLPASSKGPSFDDSKVAESNHGASRSRQQVHAFESTSKRFAGSTEPLSSTPSPAFSSSKTHNCLSKSERSRSFNTSIIPPLTRTTAASTSDASIGCDVAPSKGNRSHSIARHSGESNSPSLAAWHQKQRRRTSASHVLGDSKSVQSSISALQQHQTMQSKRQHKWQTSDESAVDRSSAINWLLSDNLPPSGTSSSGSALQW